MIKRCWCGRERVWQIDEATAHTEHPSQSLVCPVHGEKCVWRPCVFGKDFEVSTASEVDQGGWPYVRGCDRRCKLIAELVDPDEAWVSPQTCASCLIPALVEAVKGILGIGITRDWRGSMREVPLREFLAIREMCKVALAALPKKEN